MSCCEYLLSLGSKSEQEPNEIENAPEQREDI